MSAQSLLLQDSTHPTRFLAWSSGKFRAGRPLCSSMGLTHIAPTLCQLQSSSQCSLSPQSPCIRSLSRDPYLAAVGCLITSTGGLVTLVQLELRISHPDSRRAGLGFQQSLGVISSSMVWCRVKHTHASCL